MFYSTSENLPSLSKEEFLQNKILFLMECHPLHHRVLMDATPFKVLCPRRGPQVRPAAWTTLTARVLSACLCAMSVVYLPDLRLISTQEPAPPWLLHVIVFRDKQEIATAKEDFSWCPQCSSLGALLRRGRCNHIKAGTVTTPIPQAGPSGLPTTWGLSGQ